MFPDGEKRTAHSAPTCDSPRRLNPSDCRSLPPVATGRIGSALSEVRKVNRKKY
jgi:hypothetical protein